MDLPDVIDTFTLGFSASRSITYPFIVERVGPLWMMRDKPRSDAKKERNREYVALDTSAARVVKTIGRTKPRGYVICVAHRGTKRNAGIEAEYKALNYRYARGEPFFVKEVTPIPRRKSPLPVRRVDTLEAARIVAKAARARQIDEKQITQDDPDARLFAAYDGKAPVGWVSSIRTVPTYAWVANLFVDRRHRNKGIGRALMLAMLRDDAERGITHSVLTASTAGSLLYPKIGYEQVGMLQLFLPPKNAD